MTAANVTMDLHERLLQLTHSVVELPDFKTVIEKLQAGNGTQVDGAWGSSCALGIAALARQAAAPLLVVCPTGKEVDDFCDDLPHFTDAAVWPFPAWESEQGQRLVYDEIYAERLSALKRLMLPKTQGIWVTSIQSLLQLVPPRDAIVANTRHVNVGDMLDLEQFAKWLAMHGFHGTSGVELPGEFALRGGILDLFAPDWQQPVRLELFGDQVESLRRFDISTQRSLESVDRIEVTILPSGSNNDMRSAERRESLLDYLPSASWTVLHEPLLLQEAATNYLSRLEHPEFLHGIGETLATIGRFGNVSLTALAPSGNVDCRLPVDSVERLRGDVKTIRDEMEKLGDDHQIAIFCQTEGETQRMEELLAGVPVVLQGRLHLTVGCLNGGFGWRPEKLLLLTVNQLFDRTVIRRKQGRVLGKKIDSFLDLRNGDLVVHLAHGIGRYRGMEVLSREHQIEEHLIIEFAGGTKVYVPATKIDLVQKYVGGRKSRPKLATLGGKTWQKTKKAAAAAVTDMAAELLERHARREAMPGIALSQDTTWQSEFDASFPYTETDDQLTAIDAIKGDMEVAQPMDRLLCGDVGFGKTEVAMRAAFKAVDNGYQVALMVPTTVLTEQHYRTFRERMAAFPIEIAKLSRFCSAKETKDTVRRIADGSVDVAIGTHRLASKDIRFHNLGLVIIDEEQRFGVEVKERLRSLKTTVDILTMTATPIPRTLHMSMTGMRDICNLEIPPADRIAVETRISRWDDHLIRSAIVRELGRGGQVYFVHNRVQDIHTIQAKLEALVPEATIRVGHGQMGEGDLEKVMVDFVAGDFNILLATTIVESGLDIPNANTIFIDEADRYGLADLHQLRGRVGRYKHRAYCYLLIDQKKHITPQAARRLRAIEEFSEMGAGFAIAMRDLEFRGAGNVLGTQQSGHIAAVGYELYCQLLEAAVRRLRQLPPKLTIDVNIDLPGDAFLTDDYVPGQRQKIDIYRRMSRIASEDDLLALKEELSDRFGPPPPATQRLLDLLELKIEAAIWQITAVKIEDRFLVFEYADEGRIRQLAKLRKGALRVVDHQSAYFTLKDSKADPDEILKQAKSVLRTD